MEITYEHTEENFTDFTVYGDNQNYRTSIELHTGWAVNLLEILCQEILSVPRLYDTCWGGSQKKYIAYHNCFYFCWSSFVCSLVWVWEFWIMWGFGTEKWANLSTTDMLVQTLIEVEIYVTFFQRSPSRTTFEKYCSKSSIYSAAYNAKNKCIVNSEKSCISKHIKDKDIKKFSGNI